MSGALPVGEAPIVTSTWRVRDADASDTGAVVAAVTELLIELGATPPRLPTWRRRRER